MRRTRLTALVALIVTATAPGEAVTRSKAATATVAIAALAKLSLSGTTLSFPDANPDLVPAIPSAGGSIIITAKTRTTAGSTVNLSVLATDDLRSAVATIAASNLTWTATGSGFQGGSVSSTIAQSVATWVSSGSRMGSQSYFFTNRWDYATGSYSTTLMYTLSAP